MWPDRNGSATHTREFVYHEMYLNICRTYHSLPDPRSLTYDEIEEFYDGIRAELREATKPRD